MLTYMQDMRICWKVCLVTNMIIFLKQCRIIKKITESQI